MSETKHTPGPWSYRPNGYGWHDLCGPGGLNIWTASARTGEDAANRLLIAAAPEMYAALLELGDAAIASKHVDQDTKEGIAAEIRFGRAMEQARKAIAKAEGRS